jgi:hypothetical protein
VVSAKIGAEAIGALAMRQAMIGRERVCVLRSASPKASA